MYSARKYFLSTLVYTLGILILLAFFTWKTDRQYDHHAPKYKIRTILLNGVFLATPANVPAGRNIAFEVGNAVSNAPASYLTMLDCCESDEAIADRIAVGQTRCTILRKE